MELDQNPEDMYGLYQDSFILRSNYHNDILVELNNFYDNERWQLKKFAYLPDLAPRIQIDTKVLEGKDL